MVRTKNHNERCKDCKERVKQLLEAIFGNVEVNYDLKLPARLEGYSDTDIYADIEPIYLQLQKYRGFDVFVKAKKLPRVDFFIPGEDLIVEFDESQHFTKPREITLSYYPKEKEYGYSIQKWYALCQTLNKRDNDPPYRDEQRAWYDTLRDFAPLLWGRGKTIRLYSRELVWCSLDPENKTDITKFKELLLNNTETTA